MLVASTDASCTLSEDVSSENRSDPLHSHQQKNDTEPRIYYPSCDYPPQETRTTDQILRALNEHIEKQSKPQKDSIFLIINYLLFKSRTDSYHAKHIRYLPINWFKSDCFYMDEKGVVMPIFLSRWGECKRSLHRTLRRYSEAIVLFLLLGLIGFSYWISTLFFH